MAQLTCKNLTIGYDGREVLSNLNFEVNTGDYLYIVGENGAGKSTLVKTVLGLQNPMSGEIISGDGLKENEIGYLPQQTVVQKDFPASVSEIVLSGFQARMGLRPFYNKDEKEMMVLPEIDSDEDSKDQKDEQFDENKASNYIENLKFLDERSLKMDTKEYLYFSSCSSYNFLHGGRKHFIEILSKILNKDF